MAEPHFKTPSVLRKALEAVTRQASGYAYPGKSFFVETASIPLGGVMELYERDPTCKSNIDLLAASTVGMGFYTTCAQGQEKAKEVVDRFNEEVNLDGLH